MAEELGLDSLVLGADPGGTEVLRATGGQRITGNSTIGGNNAVMPSLTTGIVFALDSSQGVANGGTVVLNNGTFGIGGAFTFSGLVILTDTATTGSSAIFLCSGNVAVLITTSGTAEYSSTAATASKINLYYVAGQLTVENKTGGTRTITVMALRTRAS